MRQNVNILKPEIIDHNAAAGSSRITVSADVDRMGNVRHQNSVGDFDILGISPVSFLPRLGACRRSRWRHRPSGKSRH